MLQERICRRQKKRWHPPSAPCHVWRALSRLPITALGLSLVLCLASCATTKKTVSEQEQTETVREQTSVKVTATKQIRREAIPPSQVSLTIPVDSLPALPQGASYHGRSGQAGIEVSRQGDQILVTGTCDSLEREVEYYSDLYCETLQQLHEQQQRFQTVEKSRSDPVKTALTGLLIGLIVGGTTVAGIIKLKH